MDDSDTRGNVQKTDVEMLMPQDGVNRDPNSLNDQLKVLFEDTIGEPDGAHSVTNVWKGAKIVFTGVRSGCYKALTLLFAFPIAVGWGFVFAVISFFHIWFVTPFIMLFKAHVRVGRRIFTIMFNCIIEPLYQAAVSMRSRFHLITLQGSENNKECIRNASAWNA